MLLDIHKQAEWDSESALCGWIMAFHIHCEWARVTCPECLAKGVADRITASNPPPSQEQAFENMWGRTIKRDTNSTK